MIIDKIRKTIEYRSMISPGDRVVVGLSGGPDSVCLFHGLCALKEELGIGRIYAVHINHGLRGAESDEDERYVKKLAESFKAECISFNYDVNAEAQAWGMSTEEAGRMIRYSAFEKVRRQKNAQRIAVAHNLNDQAETIIMRIMRGTGVKGLSGISYIRSDGVVIRPVLDLSRQEIEDYCKQNGLEPRIDSTNNEPIYTRNKIRLNLLPEIEREFNPNIVSALVRLGSQAAEDEDFMSAEAVKYLDSKSYRESAIDNEYLKSGCKLSEDEVLMRKRMHDEKDSDMVLSVDVKGDNQHQSMKSNSQSQLNDANYTGQDLEYNQVEGKNINTETAGDINDRESQTSNLISGIKICADNKNSNQSHEEMNLKNPEAEIINKKCRRWNQQECSLMLDGFSRLHPAVAKRVIRLCAKRAGLDQNMDAAHVESIIELIGSGAESKETDITKGYYARLSYGRLWFLNRKNSSKIESAVAVPYEELLEAGIAEVQAGGISIYMRLIQADGEKPAAKRQDCKVFLYLDFDKLTAMGRAAFRNKLPGDRIRPKGMKGSKKLQDFFVDRKIPKHLRETTVLLACGGRIVAAGKEVSAECVQSVETMRILTIEY